MKTILREKAKKKKKKEIKEVDDDADAGWSTASKDETMLQLDLVQCERHDRAGR